MFWEIFSKLCEESGKSPSSVAAELDFSNATTTKWKKGAIPRRASLVKIARYFGVPVSQLLKAEQTNMRYMLDTCAIIKIANNTADEMILYQSKRYGFKYCFSEVQCAEIGAASLKRLDELGNPLSECVQRSNNLFRIIAKLQSEHLDQIATFRFKEKTKMGELVPIGGWTLGGDRIVADDEVVEMMKAIHNDNDKRYDDSEIAGIGIQSNCIIVSDDAHHILKHVNTYFPGRAIPYDDFIQAVKNHIEKSSPVEEERSVSENDVNIPAPQSWDEDVLETVKRFSPENQATLNRILGLLRDNPYRISQSLAVLEAMLNTSP